MPPAGIGDTDDPLVRDAIEYADKWAGEDDGDRLFVAYPMGFMPPNCGKSRGIRAAGCCALERADAPPQSFRLPRSRAI